MKSVLSRMTAFPGVCLLPFHSPVLLLQHIMREMLKIAVSTNHVVVGIFLIVYSSIDPILPHYVL